MKVSSISIKNFRRLEDVEFSLEDDHTVFVGPNNSGKTSAASAFRYFFRKSDFSINDFSVSCIREIDLFGQDASFPDDFSPCIEMNIWISLNPEVEFGRVFALLSGLSEEQKEVGIGLSYCVNDIDQLRVAYSSTFPHVEGQERKTLSHFLSIPQVLSRHFSIQYYALEKESGAIKKSQIEPQEGRRVLNSLIRVDFLDAQRNIHDQDSGRYNRLSAAFAAFYRHHLEKLDPDEGANKVIDENNSKLTAHYKALFEPLLNTISALGVPSVNDRALELVSSLDAQEVLKGNTELYYIDNDLAHKLPEAYNGLGFKNLIYMIIQISHFYNEWINTETARPLCQLIFIEEPEVHLHAQVQQTFIGNIWKILHEKIKGEDESFIPQLILTTHSSHIVDKLDFEKIRYFRRCFTRNHDSSRTHVLNATKILNLKEFTPPPPLLSDLEGGKDETEVSELKALKEKIEKETKETLAFLRRYLRLTHCDLFFADAAILVEGTVEKLLLPRMITECFSELNSKYLTILEIGGAYAHKFSGFLTFLGIPYLVLTDIDTVSADDNRNACRADTPGSHTSNASIKYYLNRHLRDEIIALRDDDQITEEGNCYISFQRPVKVEIENEEHEMHGRTLEETFIYENLALFEESKLDAGLDINRLKKADEAKEEVYATIKNSKFKKTAFALDILLSDQNWQTPTYIKNGLEWLSHKLSPPEPQ